MKVVFPIPPGPTIGRTDRVACKVALVMPFMVSLKIVLLPYSLSCLIVDPIAGRSSELVILSGTRLLLALILSNSEI